jgi:hypothetical protein
MCRILGSFNSTTLSHSALLSASIHNYPPFTLRRITVFLNSKILAICLSATAICPSSFAAAQDFVVPSLLAKKRVPASLNLHILAPVSVTRSLLYLEPITDKQEGEKAVLVQTFLYRPEQFDDLAARYSQNQQDTDLNGSLLIRNRFDNQIIATSNEKILQEYLRRIYQGYALTTANESKRNRRDSSEDLFSVSKNIIVNYQAIETGGSTEYRIGYDPVGNVTHLSYSTPVLDSEFSYFIQNRRSPAAVAENIKSIDEVMDVFAHFDRKTINFSHTFEALNLRLKTRYGLADGAIDYGFSKQIIGPLAMQVLREERYMGTAGFTVGQLTMGLRF